MLKLKKNQKGFTIIEVLIVLAIAGLIMLIVFLAVPALQRNSRTTQYKNGATAILSTINEFETNNNGQLPTTVSIAADGVITVSGATGTNAVTGKTQAGYTASAPASPTMPAAGAAVGTYVVALNYKCSGNTSFTATSRSLAVGFTVETAGSTIPQCIES